MNRRTTVARGKSVLLLFALLASGPFQSASSAAKLSLAAKLDTKTGKVIVFGAAAKPFSPGAGVTIFDATDQRPLETANLDAKGKFSATLPQTTPPCMVRAAADGASAVASVKGAPADCAQALACSIVAPDGDKTSEGNALRFSSQIVGGKKGATLSYAWDMGDGSGAVENKAEMKDGHVFSHAGRYRVTLKAGDGVGECSDALVVSVSTPAGVNHQPKVAERKTPSTGGAMPTADGKNDEGAYVAMPFEESAMMSGATVNLPYNAYPNMNALNVQVFKKVKQKPQLVDSSALSLYYSAASSPDDPVGADSITSTSQNLFAGGLAGANFDYDQSVAAKSTVFVAGHDFRDAAIKKNEFWDRMRQPVAVNVLGLKEQGQSVADTIMTAKAPPRPDQGVPGQLDKAASVRAMPGVANPYVANDPQQFDYSVELKRFVAQFIPSTDIDDQGRVNPYPLMRVEARDSSGAVQTGTDAVYTTAGETRCRECHLKGEIAAPADLWRTPVTETELTNPDGSPGPATGADMFPPGKEPTKFWPPAVHNRFDAINPFAPSVKQLAVTPENEKLAGIERDQNNLRKDRIAESRWINAAGKTSPTKPNDGDASWKLQVRLKFKGGEDYMAPGALMPTWQDEEKAALWNMMLLHDYQVWLGLTVFNPPYAFSTQLLDSLEDLRAAARGRPVNFCYSTCHISELRREVSWSARGYVYRYSDYSKQAHAFHAKLQAYKQDVDKGADGQPHKKGDLIRNERGHPIMWGGRGWDSQQTDDEAVGQPIDAATGKAKPWGWDVTKNNWREDLYPKRADGETLFPFGDRVAMEQNCLLCHSGPTEKSYRDVHEGIGVKCDDCHGDMVAVGNLYKNDGYDANLWGAGAFTGDSAHFRMPWLDEPNCGSCHIGDANLKQGQHGEHVHDLALFSAGVLKKAWMEGDPAQRSVDPMNARFAVMPFVEQRLEKVTVNNQSVYEPKPVSLVQYRKSFDVHGSGAGNDIACSACHGGSHAIWPNPDPKANDNRTAKQLQGYEGNIVECSVCHIKDDFKEGKLATDGGASNLGVGQGVRDGTLVGPNSPKAYLAGPHGMHPVNDEYWWKAADGSAVNKGGTIKGGWHNDFAKKAGPDGEDQCAACHGADHKGTRLSKTLADRVFVDEKGKTVNVVKGQIIGCDLCHSMAKSFTGVPTGAAKLHAPPAATPLQGGGTTTGGGGGHGHG